MIPFLPILLAGGFSLAASFALTFTAVSIYILWKRRSRSQFCYAEPAEPTPVRKCANVGWAEPESNIDGGSAVQDWAKRT